MMRYLSTGELLIERRKNLRMKQFEVAQKLKLTSQFYGRLEKGSVGIPKSKMNAVCKVLIIQKLELVQTLCWDYKKYLLEVLK